MHTGPFPPPAEASSPGSRLQQLCRRLSKRPPAARRAPRAHPLASGRTLPRQAIHLQRLPGPSALPGAPSPDPPTLNLANSPADPGLATSSFLPAAAPRNFPGWKVAPRAAAADLSNPSTPTSPACPNPGPSVPEPGWAPALGSVLAPCAPPGPPPQCPPRARPARGRCCRQEEEEEEDEEEEEGPARSDPQPRSPRIPPRAQRPRDPLRAAATARLPGAPARHRHRLRQLRAPPRPFPPPEPAQGEQQRRVGDAGRSPSATRGGVRRAEPSRGGGAERRGEARKGAAGGGAQLGVGRCGDPATTSPA